jgi:hypothetical protein
MAFDAPRSSGNSRCIPGIAAFHGVREVELSGMTHVCCRWICTQVSLCLYDERVKPDSKEIDEILEAEKGLASKLDKKIEQSMRDQNRESVEEDWLSTLVDFYIPNRLLQRQPWWHEWDPATGYVSIGHRIKPPLKEQTRASLNNPSHFIES